MWEDARDDPPPAEEPDVPLLEMPGVAMDMVDGSEMRVPGLPPVSEEHAAQPQDEIVTGMVPLVIEDGADQEFDDGDGTRSTPSGLTTMQPPLKKSRMSGGGHQALLCADSVGRITLKPSSWGGSDDVPAQAWHVVNFERWLKLEEAAHAEHMSVSEVFEARNHVLRRGGDGDFYLSSADGGPEIMQSFDIEPGLSRKERKAMDKETPWRSIFASDPDQLELYRDGVSIEWMDWLSWKAVKPVPDDLAKRILGGQQRRRRVLAPRFVYRDKNLGSRR